MAAGAGVHAGSWRSKDLNSRIWNGDLSGWQTDLLAWRCRRTLAGRSLDHRVRSLRFLYSIGFYDDSRRMDAEVPLILPSLRGTDAREREAAAKALGSSHVASEEVVRALVGALDDTDARVVLSGLLALRRLGPGAAGAAPKVLEMLEAGREPYRTTYSLGGFGTQAKLAVPTLARRLGTTKGAERYITIWALGQIGPAAAETLPALREVLNDPQGDHNLPDSEMLETAHEAIRLIEERGPP